MLVVSGVRVTSSLIVSLTWISISHKLLVFLFFCGFWSYLLNQDIKTIEVMSAGINPS